jgi:hypothetical protein
VKKTTALAAATAAATALALTSCSAYDAAHNHNAPTPVRDWRPPQGWLRIDTPGNFPSAVFACHGKDGIYASMDNSSTVIAVPNDPECTTKAGE